MALADTARLATVLTLKDGLSPGLNKPIGTVGKFGRGMDTAGKKVGAFTGKLKTAGAVAGGALAGGLLLGIKSGLNSLGELESATTSVEAALKQMGKAGDVTAAQVADWANEIEAATDAAFDDKAITAATTTLIRFGKVTTKNLRPAMEVMTDLAAKTGDVDSAASLLAKALADPEKAAGKLARQGIILTEAQQKQIKAFVKAGKTGKAQQVVLDAIAKSTKGAAAAMNGPYVDAQRKLDDAVEDGTKLLAQGFLPLITEVSEELRKAVSDPGTQADIKAFGKGLADGFKSALTFVKQIPWGAIKDGLKTGAQWAGKLMDAFKSLPPEAQATIVALAGLNKLSGGAITGIVSELGKGLIKGVLGMTAGVVNIKAATVNGGGGGIVPGTGGKPTSTAGKLLDGASKLLIVGMVAEFADQLKPAVQGLASDIHEWLKLPDFKLPIPEEWPWGPKNTPTILPEIFGGNGLLGGTADNGGGSGAHTDFTGGRGGAPIVKAVNENKTSTVAATNRVKDKVGQIGQQGMIEQRTHAQRTKSAIDQVKVQEQRSLTAFRAGERATLGVKSAVNSKLSTANARLAQIRAKRTVFTTNVRVNTAVSVRNVNNSVTTSNRYGSKTLSQAS